MCVFPELCVFVQVYLWGSALPLSLPAALSSFWEKFCLSGFLIGLCPLISDKEGIFCLFHWLVMEHESSQSSCLVSAKLAAVPSESTECASLLPQLCVFSVPLLLRISPARVSLPIKHFPLPAFLFGYAPVSGFTIGLCPINSDNNGPLCLFDWIVPECGSSEFTLAVSANHAVLS